MIMIIRGLFDHKSPSAAPSLVSASRLSSLFNTDTPQDGTIRT